MNREINYDGLHGNNSNNWVGWRSDEEVAIALADTWRNFSVALAFKASNTEIVWLFLLRIGGK